MVMEKFRFNTKDLKERRRELRKNQTKTEKVLWEQLRGKRLGGFKFYRQYSIGPYIIDFYCSKLRLAIEIDGAHHREEGTILYDKERSNYLRSVNVKIIRFWNDEIIKNTEGVIDKIKKESIEDSPPLS